MRIELRLNRIGFEPAHSVVGFDCVFDPLDLASISHDRFSLYQRVDLVKI